MANDPTRYIIGESGTVGFPVVEPAPIGTDMPLDGLELRVRIEDIDRIITIPAYATDGDFIEEEGQEPVYRGSVIAIDVTPEIMPSKRGTYEGRVEINDGTGWRMLPDGDILFYVEDF